MTAFIQALLKLLAVSMMKSIAFLMLPDAGVGKSGRRGINIVMLFLTVDTVTKLLEEVWSF